MTLIISCATQDYTIQVSDRRLTWRDKRLADDHQNKGVLFEFRMAFGYTGQAELEGEKTDIWLTKVLADSRCTSLSNALTLLKEQATLKFQNLNIPNTEKQHSFVAVGWSRQFKDPVFRPTITRTSNYSSLFRPTRTDPAHFENSVVILRHNEYIRLFTDGATLPDDVKMRMRGKLRRQARRGDSPAEMVLTLVRAIRACAAVNPTVGNNLLSVVIPKAAIKTTGFQFASTGGALSDTITFQSWPENDWNGTMWGPNCASSGSASTNFSCGPIDSEYHRRLGGMTSEPAGTNTMRYPCCAVRRTSSTQWLTNMTSLGKAIVVFTENDLLNTLIQAQNDVEPVLFRGRAEFNRFLNDFCKNFEAVAFNPGGPRNLSYALKLAEVIRITGGK